jgi:hypothetical protein
MEGDIVLTSVGDASLRDSGADDAPVTGDAGEALQDSEALSWASMALWTDVAVRSNPEVIESTISALNQGLREQNDARRRSSRGLRTRISFAIVAAASSLVLVIGLATTSLSASDKTILTSVLTILVSATGFLLGGVYAAAYIKKRAGRERVLFRSVLNHELDYRRRLLERDS